MNTKNNTIKKSMTLEKAFDAIFDDRKYCEKTACAMVGMCFGTSINLWCKDAFLYAFESHLKAKKNKEE